MLDTEYINLQMIQKYLVKVNNQEEAEKMQTYIDEVVQWSLERQMLINVKKCKTMHIGKQQHLVIVTKEKDAGVVIGKELKSFSQCTKAYKLPTAC